MNEQETRGIKIMKAIMFFAYMLIILGTLFYSLLEGAKNKVINEDDFLIDRAVEQTY
jgi:hypothetical protein